MGVSAIQFSLKRVEILSSALTALPIDNFGFP